MAMSQYGEAFPKVSDMTKGQYYLMRIGQESRPKPNEPCACVLASLGTCLMRKVSISQDFLMLRGFGPTVHIY
jgi:hypothetical protein